VRWLLLKDLQILRRSPLQAFLLVAYPVLIAVLVGFAISRSPDKPRIALLNEVPANTRVSVGGQQLPAAGVSDRICSRVECVDVKDRAEARDEVESGEVLAAVVLPADLVNKINSLGTLTPGTRQECAQFAPDELRAAVEEAHRHGLPMTAHAHDTPAIIDALAAGVDGMKHVSF